MLQIRRPGVLARPASLARRALRPIGGARRRGPSLLVLVLLTALLLPVRAAEAQSRREILPGPISGRDLDRWAVLLELSPQQRLGLDAAHARYLEAYRTLQDKEFDPFTTEATRSIQAMFLAPDPDRIREILRDLDGLRRKAARQDQRLFADVAALLGPNQLELMPRVEDRRERDRARTGFVRLIGFANDAARADLSAMLEMMPMGPNEQAAIEPVMMEYERRLTATMRDLENRSEKALVEIVEALAAEIAQGLNLAAGDRQAVFDRLLPKFFAATDPVLDEADAIAQLHRRSVRDMTALLPEEVADEIRAAWWGVVYDDVQDEFEQALRPFDRVLALGGLDEAVKAEVEAARADLRLRLLEMGDQATRALDRVRTRPEVFGQEREGVAADQERAEQTGERMERTGEEARDALARLVGEERLAEAMEREPEAERGSAVVRRLMQQRRWGGDRGGASGRGGTPAGPPLPADAEGPDAWIAGPMDVDELARGLAWVGVDDSALEAARGLHADYLSRWNELDETLFEPLADAAADARPRGRGSEVDMDARARVRALRLEAEAAVRELDGSFVEQLLVACVPNDDDATARFERLVAARDRARSLTTGTDASGRFGGWGGQIAANHGNEGSIDLFRTVLALELDPPLRDRLAASLLDWEAAANAAAAAHRAVATDYEASFDEGWKRMSELRAAGDANGGNDWRRWRDAFAPVQEQGERLGESVRQLVALHRSSLAGLLRQLEGQDRTLLRSAYLRQARPAIYRDGQSAQALLDRALRLDGLNDRQREQLLELTFSYRAEWEAASDRLAEFEQAQFDPNAGEGGPEWTRWQRLGESRRDVDRLRQDRRELSDRTARRLEAIVGPVLAVELGLGATTPE